MRRAPRDESEEAIREINYGVYDLYPCVWLGSDTHTHDAWIYLDEGYWNPIKLERWTIWHEVHAYTREEFRYHYPDLEIPIKDRTGDKPEIRFGEYDSCPCIWDTEADENRIHEAWIYVDDHWNKIRLEAWTVWNELRPLLLGEEWCKKYPGVPVAEPFVALVESQNRRARH